MRPKFYPKFCEYTNCYVASMLKAVPSFGLTVEDGKPICRIKKKNKMYIEKEECDVFRVNDRMNEFKLFILLEELKIPINKDYKWIGIK